MSDDVSARDQKPAEGPLTGDQLDEVTGGSGMTPPVLPPPHTKIVDGKVVPPSNPTPTGGD